MEQKSLYENLYAHAASNAYPFHMPGHKRRIEGDLGLSGLDLTELEGFDNLCEPSGSLLDLTKSLQALFKSEKTYIMTGGATQAVLTAITAACPHGAKLIMDRNSHISAYNAAILGELHTVYCMASNDGLISTSDIEDCLERNADAAAVFVTSPTYEGFCLDIKSIARAVHAKGVMLIVDEAFGSHFCMPEFGKATAVCEGADFAVNSLHKTLACMNQSAILHANGSLVDMDKLYNCYRIFQTTSPSYPIMASMEYCVNLIMMEGKDRAKRLLDYINKLNDTLSRCTNFTLEGREDHDPAKLLIHVSGKVTGVWLERELRETYDIWMEMPAMDYTLGIATIMDSREGFLRLGDALIELDVKTDKLSGAGRQIKHIDKLPVPQAAMPLHKAIHSKRKAIDLKDSAGRACGSFITPYPPGSPMLALGEIITDKHIERIGLLGALGLSVQGLIGEDKDKILFLS